MFVLRIICVMLALCLTACSGQSRRDTSTDGALMLLSPASLGHDLALQQRLTLHAGKASQDFDALLEVDSLELRLSVQVMGQSALALRWDGKQLRQQRAYWVPATLQAEHVLSDLQLVFWPAESVRSALPAGWTLLETSHGRQMMQASAQRATVRYLEPGHVVLERFEPSYRLDIVSQDLSVDRP